MKVELEEVSVVVPTLNCRHLLEPVIDSLRDVAIAVGEVIVVDSESNDGTLELLKETLQGEGVHFHTRPRGLYQSWNYGNEKVSKRWIHIATAGDAIALDELSFLVEVAAKHDADVVCAPPRFVTESGDSISDLAWPIFDLLEEYEDSEFVLLAKASLEAFSLTHGRPRKGYRGWLGSSASNLYRAEILKKMPFPTEVGRTGDTFWGVQNAHRLSAVFCRRRCGRFVVHEKCGVSESIGRDDLRAFYNQICSSGIQRLVEDNPALGEDRHLRNLIFDLAQQERLLVDRLSNTEQGTKQLRLHLDRCRAELKQREAALKRIKNLFPRPLNRVWSRFVSWVMAKGDR